jgi:hypothetical protein
MRSRQLFLRVESAVLIVWICGCSHSRKVEDIEGSPRSATADSRGNPEIISNPEHPLVVDAPEKLLRPGGGHRIQEALMKNGILTQPDREELGTATIQALLRFQGEKNLAATGFPDAETLRALDLDPDEIYRSPLQRSEIEKLTRKQVSEARKASAKEDKVEPPREN